MGSKQLGIFGEQIAEDYLKNKGYQILGKNYSFRVSGNPQKGEVDVIVKKNDIISFIEVIAIELNLNKKAKINHF